MKKFILSFLILFSFSFGFFVLAQDSIIAPDKDETGKSIECNPESCVDEKAKDVCKNYCGNYGVNDILQTGVRITTIILGLVGSLALLYMIYGGFVFLLSGGSSEKVSKGKAIITNAIIGVTIVFFSYMIIQFTMDSLGYKNDGSIYGGSWYQAPTE